MKSQTFNIPANPIEADKIIDGAVRRLVKAHAIAGNRVAVRVCEPMKSRDQEEKYHAMIGEISSQIGGDLANEEDAKRILISAFRIDTLRDPHLAKLWESFSELRMGRGLRGEVVLMGIQSREFGVKLGSAFIEWLYAFGSESGVVFTERTLDPETGEIVTCRREPRQLEAV